LHHRSRSRAAFVAQIARAAEKLAGGAISLSVAVLLKQRLTDANCAQLLRAVSGKTVGQAREVLAGWFPQPDAPSSIRKLPERTRTASSNGDAASIGGGATLASGTGARAGSCDDGREREGGQPEAPDDTRGARELQPTEPQGSGEVAEVGPAPAAAYPSPPAAERGVPPAEPLLSAAMEREPPLRARTRASSAIEPLSPERYKIVFTADAELKRKLELARDLLRHAVPSGDLATIVGRALDLLLDETSRRRFAKTERSKAPPRSTSQAAGEVAPLSTTALEHPAPLSRPQSPRRRADVRAPNDRANHCPPSPAATRRRNARRHHNGARWAVSCARARSSGPRPSKPARALAVSARAPGCGRPACRSGCGLAAGRSSCPFRPSSARPWTW